MSTFVNLMKEKCVIYFSILEIDGESFDYKIKSKLLEDLTLHLYLSLNILSQKEHLIFLIFK